MTAGRAPSAARFSLMTRRSAHCLRFNLRSFKIPVAFVVFIHLFLYCKFELYILIYTIFTNDSYKMIELRKVGLSIGHYSSENHNYDIFI